MIDRLSKDAYQQRVAILPWWVHQVLRAAPELAVLDDLYRVEWAQHLFWRYNIQSLDLVQMPRMPEDMAAFEGAFQPRQMTDLPQLLTRRWELTNTRYLLGPADYLSFLNQQIDPVQQRFRIAERFNIVGKPGIAQPTKLEELTANLATNGMFALIEFTGALPRAKLYTYWQVNTNEQAVFVQTPLDVYNLDSFAHRRERARRLVWTDRTLFFRVIQRGRDWRGAAAAVRELRRHPPRRARSDRRIPCRHPVRRPAHLAQAPQAAAFARCITRAPSPLG